MLKRRYKGTVYLERLKYISMLAFILLIEILQRPMSGIWHKQPTTKCPEHVSVSVHQWSYVLKN